MIDIMFVVKTFIIQLRFFNVFNQNPSKFKGLNPSFLKYWNNKKKKKKSLNIIKGFIDVRDNT